MLNQRTFVTDWEFDCPIGSEIYKEKIKDMVEYYSYRACFAAYVEHPTAQRVTVFGCISSQLHEFPKDFSIEKLKKEIPEWIESCRRLGFEFPNLIVDFPQYKKETFVALEFDYGHIREATHKHHKLGRAYFCLLRFIWENFPTRLFYQRFTKFVKDKDNPQFNAVLLSLAEYVTMTQSQVFISRAHPDASRQWLNCGHDFISFKDFVSETSYLDKDDRNLFSVFSDTLVDKGDGLVFYAAGQVVSSRILNKVKYTKVLSYKETLKKVKQFFRNVETSNG